MEMHTWPLGSLWEKVSWPLVNKKLLALMYSNGHCKVCIGSNDLKLGRQVTNNKKNILAVSEWKHTLWKGHKKVHQRPMKSPVFVGSDNVHMQIRV